MFTSGLLVFLLTTMPPTEAASNQKSAESLQVSIGDMKFSGKSIQLTSGQSKQAESSTPVFKCAIDGDAQCTFVGSHPDITITAQNMIVTSNDNSVVLIRCIGECKLTGILLKGIPDRIRIGLDKPVLVYGAYQINTVPWGGGYIAGESMIFSDASFQVSPAPPSRAFGDYIPAIPEFPFPGPTPRLFGDN